MLDSTAPTTDRDTLEAYSRDVSGRTLVPEGVARPRNEAEIVEILHLASMDRSAVTPAGSQTSTTGASITDVGILVSMRAMDRINDVDVHRRSALVQPGGLLGALNRELAPHSLMFAPDPTSLEDVTVGGPSACNASGAPFLRFGTTRRHIAGLGVVMSDGSTMRVRRTGLEKNTVGLALAHEPVDWVEGSEGTLGVVVQAELSLTQIAAMRTEKNELDPFGILSSGNSF